jgi:DNA invertase Pin-like site-specific DNA recombinase
VSTPDQEKGHGLTRQLSKAEEWCVRQGIALDSELRFSDRGVSAFRGLNAQVGQLRAFLRAIEDGQILQGDFLLVENVDRLSRQTPRKALRTLEEIVEHGVSVVTLDDGKIYDESAIDAPMGLMWLVVSSARAHDESLRKSERLRKAWISKREHAATKPLTARVPAWLRLNEDRTFFIIKDRAAVVRRIFEMTAEGTGLNRIAQVLNRENIPTFGKAKFWQRSYIQKLVDNPAVIGTLTPHSIEWEKNDNGNLRKVRRPHDTIEQYYPDVVAKDLYRRVRAMRERHAPATRTATVQNVLAGLAVCERCKGSMTRVSKGSRKRAGKPYLVCAKAKAGAGCTYEAVRQELVEDALRKALPRLRPLSGKERAKALAEIEELQLELAMVSDRIGNITHEMSIQPSEALRTKLAELEEEEQAVEEILRRLQERTKPNVLLSKDQLKHAITMEAQELNALLRQVLRHVELSTAGMKVRWKDERAAVVLFEPQDAKPWPRIS